MTEKKKRGFAVMDPARVRELAAQGGRKVHAIGRAHRWTPDEARAAGALGGRAHARAQQRKHHLDKSFDTGQVPDPSDAA